MLNSNLRIHDDVHQVPPTCILQVQLHTVSVSTCWWAVLPTSCCLNRSCVLCGVFH